jgi:hypothetical protein
MFAQFDRPDWDGSTDRSIDVFEFTEGLRSLNMDLTDQQIQDVFNMVDKNREYVCIYVPVRAHYVTAICLVDSWRHDTVVMFLMLSWSKDLHLFRSQKIDMHVCNMCKSGASRDVVR